jgi:macrolide-specific efflux system membrane fusion protein
MTTTATVITGSATNVIQISATAVTTRGSNAFVNLVHTINGKQVQTPQTVVIGLRGDSSDEITSGLKVGDVVALPQTIRSSSSNGFAQGGVPSGFGALAGAGGAVRVGGGGFGG